jgi:hypothetical protein
MLLHTDCVCLSHVADRRHRRATFRSSPHAGMRQGQEGSAGLWAMIFPRGQPLYDPNPYWGPIGETLEYHLQP